MEVHWAGIHTARSLFERALNPNYILSSAGSMFGSCSYKLPCENYTYLFVLNLEPTEQKKTSKTCSAATSL